MLSRLETKESTLHAELYLSKIKRPQQKNNFARASRFFVYFFVIVVARLQRET